MVPIQCLCYLYLFLFPYIHDYIEFNPFDPLVIFPCDFLFFFSSITLIEFLASYAGYPYFLNTDYFNCSLIIHNLPLNSYTLSYMSCTFGILYFRLLSSVSIYLISLSLMWFNSNIKSLNHIFSYIRFPGAFIIHQISLTSHNTS